MPRHKLPPCLHCGKKLPYDTNSRMIADGVRERVRKCMCGYVRMEKVVTTISEWFPETDSPAKDTIC